MVPSGAINDTSRLPLKVCVMFTRTFTAATLPVSAKLIALVTPVVLLSGIARLTDWDFSPLSVRLHDDNVPRSAPAKSWTSNLQAPTLDLPLNTDKA